MRYVVVQEDVSDQIRSDHGPGIVIHSVNFRSSMHLYRQAIQVINDGKDELGAVSSFLCSWWISSPIDTGNPTMLCRSTVSVSPETIDGRVSKDHRRLIVT